MALKSDFQHTGTWMAAAWSPPPPPPRMCCRPVLFFLQLQLIALSFPQGRIRCAFQKRSYIFAFLKIGWVWNCVRQGVTTPRLILKVAHHLVRLIYLHYIRGGVTDSKVKKERHLSLSGDVGYSLRFSCKTLETRVVEIISSVSYFGGSRFESCFGIRLSSLDL